MVMTKISTTRETHTDAHRVDLFAVDGAAAAEAGRTVWWTLHGAVSVIDFEEACARAGLDHDLPKQPEAKTHLARAMEAQRQNTIEGRGRCLRRPLEVSGAYALVLEDAEGDDLSYSIDIRAAIDRDGQQLVIEPDNTPAAGALRSEYYRQRSILTADDIGKWMLRALHGSEIEAVTLRECGGLYFVPNRSLAAWSKYVRVLHEVTAHKVHEMPALPSDETVNVLLDALTREATKLVGQVTQDLEEETKPKGIRALQTSIRKLEDMKAKLAKYNDMLGVKLPEIEDNLTSVRANVVEHVIYLEIAKTESD